MSKSVEGIDQRTAAESERRTVHREPHVWGRVPPRNPNFSGREELLEQMSKRLTAGGAEVLPSVLHGMGGAGKTQIAIEYIYRHLAEYDLVWWIQAEHPEQIRNDLTELAHRLRLPGSAEPTVPAVLSALRSGRTIGRWLLVYDSAADPEDIRDFFPMTGPGEIIVTSRDPDWAETLHSIKVPPFRSESAMATLKAKEQEGKYDVFLCYSSRDRNAFLRSPRR